MIKIGAESARFNATNKTLADQTRMTYKRLVFWLSQTRNMWTDRLVNNMLKKSPLHALTHKILKTKKHHKNQNLTNVNTRKQESCRVDKENHNWKEDYISILQESKLEKMSRN